VIFFCGNIVYSIDEDVMSVIDKDNLLYDDTNSFWVVRTCVVTGIGKFIGDFIVLDIVESSIIFLLVTIGIIYRRGTQLFLAVSIQWKR
jgi:hypothetical protein